MHEQIIAEDFNHPPTTELKGEEVQAFFGTTDNCVVSTLGVLQILHTSLYELHLFIAVKVDLSVCSAF